VVFDQPPYMLLIVRK